MGFDDSKAPLWRFENTALTMPKHRFQGSKAPFWRCESSVLTGAKHYFACFRRAQKRFAAPAAINGNGRRNLFQGLLWPFFNVERLAF